LDGDEGAVIVVGVDGVVFEDELVQRGIGIDGRARKVGLGQAVADGVVCIVDCEIQRAVLDGFLGQAVGSLHHFPRKSSMSLVSAGFSGK
jgi:hypothetical protein